MQVVQSAQVERAASEDGSPLRLLPAPPKLFIPIHSADSELITLKDIGTRVERGEALVSSPQAAAFTPIAPAGGTIVAKTQVMLLNGARVAAVEISVDAAGGGDAPAPATAAAETTPSIVAELLDRVRQYGVWADRRTSPDLLGQLAFVLRRPIDTVLCNALDNDGTQTLNETVMRTFGADVVAGLLALGRATGAARTWLACDANSRGPDVANSALRAAGAGARKSVRIIPLPNDYPQADPTMLMLALLGRRLRPGKLPVEQNVLMVDAAAARAVGLATTGMAMLDVPLAVRDARGGGRTHFVRALVGTPLRFVLEMLKLDARDATIRAGAALRDLRVPCEAVVAGGELAMDVGPTLQPANPDPCIRCGWCVSSCPTRIHPAGLLEAAQENDTAMAHRYGIEACIECGICSFVCPSRLPLLAAIRGLKNAIEPQMGHR